MPHLMITTPTGHPPMLRRSLFSAIISLLALTKVGTAQTDDNAERWRSNCERDWNNDRARVCEVRTYTIAPGARLTVDGGNNGGVRFYGSDRRDVRVVALVQASADDDATAKDIARQIRVITDGGQIRSEGPSTGRHMSWSVSYDVYVPNQANLEATTENGGI